MGSFFGVPLELEFERYFSQFTSAGQGVMVTGMV